MSNNSFSLFNDIHPKDEMFLFFVEQGYSKEKAAALYLDSGRQMLKDFISITEELEIGISEKTQILEFACGYGRFTRHLLSTVSPDQISVADIYTDAVDFQCKIFGVNGFYSYSNINNIIIPASYDLIFVGSLFSHLPVSIWSDMLYKLYTSLKKGGALIFSVHGPSCINTNIPEGGLLYVESSESKSLSSEIYGSTYVTTQFVNKTVLERTNKPVKLFRHKGLYNYQDVYAVVNESINNDSIAYSIDLIEKGYVYGWALYKPNPSFKLSVQIESGGVVIAGGNADEYRNDLALAQIGDGYCSFKLKITRSFTRGEALALKVFEKKYPSLYQA